MWEISAHGALAHLLNQIEGGVLCRMAMTYSVVPSLQMTPEVADAWLPKLLARSYDPRDIPAAEKTGATLAFPMKREISGRDAGLYVPLQIAAAFAGTALAHVMFEAPAAMVSVKVRTGVGQWAAERVATFGLVGTILGCLKTRPAAVPYAVGLFFTAGCRFTASTSVAGPAVRLARAMTNTFSGIRPLDAPGFVAAQLPGSAIAVWVFAWLWRGKPDKT